MKYTAIFFALLLSTAVGGKSNFLPGYYYSIDGKKVEGLINRRIGGFSVFGSTPTSIRFKNDEKAKAVKLGVDEMSAFVIGKDSFAIASNFKINSIQGEYKKEFVQVEQIGAMNLYTYEGESSDGKNFYHHNRPVISKDGKTFYGIWNLSRQREDVAEYFSDRPDLKKRILDKAVEMEEFEALVIEYNKGK